MITAVVQFPLPERLSVEEARENFLQAAPNFQQPEGLIRKYFLLGEEGKTAGGVYLWESRGQAEEFYEEFKEAIREHHGCELEIAWFHTPVIVDNATRQIINVPKLSDD